MAPLKHHLLHKKCSCSEILSSTQTIGRITQLLYLYRPSLQIEIPHIFMLPKIIPTFIWKNFRKCFQRPFYVHDVMFRSYCHKTLKNWQQGTDLGLEEGTRLERNWFWNLPIGQSTAQLGYSIPELEILSEHEKARYWLCQFSTGFCHVTIAVAGEVVFVTWTSAQQHQRMMSFSSSRSCDKPSLASSISYSLSP